ncbi:MAG TPA: NAD(P)-dependent oxidoreductase [Candidatus Eisenbacteria bacterium]|nr:NAD(P)-dependent oxidoreductase [Candidatus Eisenbacteria bacterium]
MSSPADAAPRSRPRILVTADMGDEALDALRALGEVEYESFRTHMRLLAGAELVTALRGFHVFVTEIDVVDVEALRQVPDLRVVVSCRGQAVNIDVAACTAFGVPVLHAPGRNADAVADLTLAFMLMLLRKLPAATAFLHEPGGQGGDMARMGRAFTSLQGHELWRKVVGLVGFGAVGQGVTKRLLAFGARVLVHDPYVAAGDVQAAGAEPVGFEDLLGRSDIVSLHAAVTDATTGMIGAAEFARMRRGVHFVNTARAALVDEAALVAALESGQVAGAALDVFATEPPASDDPLVVRDDVIVTPHVGGNTAEVAAHQGAIVAEDLARLLRGETPRHALDPSMLRNFDWARARPVPDEATLARLAAGPAPAVSDLQRRPTSAPTTATASPSHPDARGPAGPLPSPAATAPAEIVERMTRILRGFLSRITSDAGLREFAAGKNVTLRFALPDLATRFHLRLRDGVVSAELGDPDTRADVELTMRAEILDGMFTGALNPMQAATSGRLSFRGDTMKAMTLQQLQEPLSRHYREARGEAGGPGDLAALAASAGAAKRAPAAPPASAGDVREELLRVVNELYASELITATGGNVSVRVPDRDEIWITPSQTFKGELRPEMLVRLDLDGNPLDPNALSPSSERLMHCAIYRARPEARAVVHAHAPHATILVDTGLPFPPISTEAAFFGDIPRVPFIMPGTDELARAVGEAARTSPAVLMQNHGLIVAGRSLRRAADMVEIIDRSAEIIIGCYAVGKPPSLLPDEVVRMLRRLGDLMA